MVENFKIIDNLRTDNGVEIVFNKTDIASNEVIKAINKAKNLFNQSCRLIIYANIDNKIKNINVVNELLIDLQGVEVDIELYIDGTFTIKCNCINNIFIFPEKYTTKITIQGQVNTLYNNGCKSYCLIVDNNAIIHNLESSGEFDISNISYVGSGYIDNITNDFCVANNESVNYTQNILCKDGCVTFIQTTYGSHAEHKNIFILQGNSFFEFQNYLKIKQNNYNDIKDYFNDIFGDYDKFNKLFLKILQQDKDLPCFQNITKKELQEGLQDYINETLTECEEE